MIAEILSLQSISFEHEGAVLLDDINLVFEKGKTYLITSEPEGGKSLLLKVAGGIIPPVRGSVKLKGHDVYQGTGGKELVKRIGSVFQESTLISNLSVEENLLLPIKYINPRYDHEEILLEIIELFRYFEISVKNLEKRPSDVSYPIRKLINIVRVIITKPEIFLIDSPHFNLDAVDRTKVHNKLLQMKENGETMVIASNDRILIKDLADEVILLSKGKIIEKCPTEDFLHSAKPVVMNFLSHHVGG